MPDGKPSRAGLWVAAILFLIALGAVIYALGFFGGQDRSKPTPPTEVVAPVVTPTAPAVEVAKDHVATTNVSASGATSKTTTGKSAAQFPT
jgi:hypothetical protein